MRSAKRRLIADIAPEVHYRFKLEAARRDISIARLTEKMIRQFLPSLPEQPHQPVEPAMHS